MAVNMPGFGNPYNLSIDVFDGALSAWMSASSNDPTPVGGSSRDRVERAMRENR
jgi:hypothetical protein